MRTASYANYAKALQELAYNDCNGLDRIYHENYKKWHFETTCILALSNNLPCLHYAISLGCPFHYLTTFHACSKGHIEILTYILERGLHVNPVSLKGAIQNGHVQIAEMLVTQAGLELGSKSLYYAMLSNSLAMLEWYRSKVGVIDFQYAHTFIYLVVSQISVHVLKWARQNGCRFLNMDLLQALSCKIDLENFHFILECILEDGVVICPTYMAQLEEQSHRLDIEEVAVRKLLFTYDDKRMLGCFPRLQIKVIDKRKWLQVARESLLSVVCQDLVDHVLMEYL